MPAILQISTWPEHKMIPLLEESEREGFRFLHRLRDDWISGLNRFTLNGEALFGAFEEEHLVAVGGINRQTDGCGRLRRFYVLKDYRRRGIGRLLVRHLLNFASFHFSRVVLHTDTEAADRFYVAVGFVRLAARANQTHFINLN